MSPTSVDVDVVVVGGGIAGVSVAWALVQCGATVRVIEREADLGYHATGRSAALLNVTVGAPRLRGLVRASRDFLAAPPSGFVDHPLLAARGLLWIGEPEQAAALDDLAAGVATTTATRISAAEVHHLAPGLRPRWAQAGGVHEPGALTVDVDALLQSYARGTRAAGGTISRGLEVTGLQHRGDAWLIDTPLGAFRCATVVDAAGAWGDVVAERAGVRPLRLTPMRRTACLVPASDVASWPHVMDVGGGFYAEPHAGGLLLSPADETPCEPGDARPEEPDVALALERLNRATDLDVRHVRRAWAGLRTFAPDRLPVAGFDDEMPGFYWLVGQGGAGIKTAPALAAMAAAAITGQGDGAESVDPHVFGVGRLR